MILQLFHYRWVFFVAGGGNNLTRKQLPAFFTLASSGIFPVQKFDPPRAENFTLLQVNPPRFFANFDQVVLPISASPG